MSLDKAVFLYEDRLVLCSREGGGYREETLSLSGEPPSLKGYALVLPDTLVTLVPTDIVPVRRRNIGEMVRLYLTGIFPEEVVRDRFGFVKVSPVIALLYAEDLDVLIGRYPKLFASAAVVTTPSLAALGAEEGVFVLKTGETTLVRKEDGFLHVMGDAEDYPLPEGAREIILSEGQRRQVLDWISTLSAEGRLRDASLGLSGLQGGFSVAALKKDLIFWGVLYVVLVLALFLRTVPLKEDVKAYEEAVAGVYSSLGIADSPDPYGMLLYKISQVKKRGAAGTAPLKVLYAASMSLDGGASVEDLSVNQELVRIKGRIESLQALEKAAEDLSGMLRLKFVIESAKVQQDGVDFIITARLKG